MPNCFRKLLSLFLKTEAIYVSPSGETNGLENNVGKSERAETDYHNFGFGFLVDIKTICRIFPASYL